MAGFRAQLNWVLCSGSQKPEIKGLVGLSSHLELRVPSKLFQMVGRIHVPAAVGLGSQFSCWLWGRVSLSS